MKTTSGFTLIELLIVVLIIGILASLAVPQYYKIIETTRIRKAGTIAAEILQSFERYKALTSVNPNQGSSSLTAEALEVMDIKMPGTFEDNWASIFPLFVPDAGDGSGFYFTFQSPPSPHFSVTLYSKKSRYTSPAGDLLLGVALRWDNRKCIANTSSPKFPSGTLSLEMSQSFCESMGFTYTGTTNFYD